MHKNYAFRTNFFICLIIIIGFSVTSVISYRSNMDTLKKEAESVTRLASEGMMYQIDAIFAQSIHISQTMAHDSFLINFLSQEKENLKNPSYTQNIKEYLSAYKKKYNYDSVFLVSMQTDRYYNFTGVDRIVNHSAPENKWVREFIAANNEFSLNIDNDKADHDTITVFVNCGVRNKNNEIVGIVGVGFKVNTVQAMLTKYEQQFAVQTYLMNEHGKVQISSAGHGATSDAFAQQTFAAVKNTLKKNNSDCSDIWYSANGANGYAVTRYLPAPNMYLVTDKNTSEIIKQIRTKYYTGAVIVLFTTLIVIIIVTTIIRRYKNKIVSITISEELKYHTILQNATSQIYDSIIEFDITNDIACGEGTKKFLQQLDLKPGTSYSAMLQAIVSKHIHPDHAALFMDTFSPDAVRRALEENRNKLSCDFLYATDKGKYVWLRETGYVLRWAENDSIHIVICRQNIDKEKKLELSLQEMAQKDGLTGLYNKMTTHDLIEKRLARHECDRGLLAMIMLDIDNFKELNDSLGHVAGDRIIQEFAQSIRAGFAADDIVGRVGGDEFVVLTLQQDEEALRKKADDLCRTIHSASFGGDAHHLAASIGVVIFPRHGKTFGDLYARADAALYRAKQNGKNTFVIFDKTFAA
ncbi:MAG: GGDEF domain-containing protein [Desulfovibrio sp.]|uniref:sensor domain-containing diguanylate cyclase n=1 Tax=Desulfovibrio sp. TaxID=885 RepID=UPI00135DE944|nr:sensor domain-containing diguanylate cyclase [Desulfovibrio sp.]MTJ93285.1 GGDEF domain-containing protein [Desulfovibrio sp.]